MKTADNPGLKKQKRANQIKGLLFLVVFIVTAVLGYYWLALLLGGLFYIAHQVLWSDHLFFDPKSDYQYSFDSAQTYSVEINNNKLAWPEELLSGFTPEVGQVTAFIKVRVKSHWTGKFFDPYITLGKGQGQNQQFFERGCDGIRYINVTDFLLASDGSWQASIEFNSRYCDLMGEAELQLFQHEDFRKKRMLIIAPHADDAEIAAFGLYSQAEDVHIVTLTAGELGERDFQHVYSDQQQAAQLKGSLRAWDSVAIPRWGGVTEDRVVNLGYFCLRLKAMHDAPGSVVPSKAAGIETTEIFRRYNKLELPSDGDYRSTWTNLIGDLSYLIDHIKPEVIVTPHLQLDPHEDHHYGTLAVKEAVAGLELKSVEWLYYANHFVHTDIYPYGPAHSLAGLPVNFDVNVEANSLVALGMNQDMQKHKAMSLAMQHDLQAPLAAKKRLRKWLQEKLVGRVRSPYGQDEYFRKAIKAHELFIRS
jgi:LmbE family N-acetylglucosaminyl deacetylase